ncbi:MAG: mechanosensitive ion channel family protein [bacterium]
MENSIIDTLFFLNINLLSDFLVKVGLSIAYVIVANILIKVVSSFAVKTFILSDKVSHISINNMSLAGNSESNKSSARKVETLSAILNSVIKYTIWFIVICSILTTFGIEISSIIAVAGVGSVAIGLGSQSVASDIITGMFILFEDQFSVGDMIKIDALQGKVETMGLRSTTVRDANGSLHIIPNGSIKIITNLSKEFGRAIVEVGVAYEENIDNVIEVLKNEMANIYNNSTIDGLTKEPKVSGVSDLGDSSVVIKIVADTEAEAQWEAERQLRRLIKNRLDKENICISYNKLVIYNAPNVEK